MKQTIIILSFIITCVGTLHANFPDRKDIALISGNTALKKNLQSGRDIYSIHLYKINKGKKIKIAAAPITQSGDFTLSFFPDKEDFFLLGYNDAISVNDHIFYFKPGDELHIAINDTSYTLAGKNTEENKEMERWHNLVCELELHARYGIYPSSFVEFFPLLTEKQKAWKSYQQQYTKNATFNTKFRNLQALDIYHNAFLFLFSPRIAHPQKGDMTEIYQQATLDYITENYNLLAYPYGLELFGFIQSYPHLFGETEEPSTDEYERIAAKIKDKDFLGEWLLSYIKIDKKSYIGVKSVQSKYAHLLNKEHQEILEQLVQEYAAKEGSQEFIDFTLEDSNGKAISLSDFKGKIVYVDIWATWCAPCIKEIPSLKVLEKKYEGKDIVFLSISIDQSSDKEKWKKFITARELGGVQLFVGEQKIKFSNAYQIANIPRFMVFSKEGKVLMADAPRPSSAEINLLLDSLVQ